jgi:quercetin dioxygenase-like cupin family protein
METTNTCKVPVQSDELNRLPWLADPLLKFDLSRELLELRSKDSWGRGTGRSSKTLAKHSDFRVVLVLMKVNTQMNQHQAEGRISIQQLFGRILVRLPHQQVTLSSGELLVLDGAVLHDIEAKEESAFLLTISWRNDTKDGRKPAGARKERTFDKDAVLRMEDEGGGQQTPKWT